MRQSNLNQDNTLVKLKTSAKLHPDAHVSSMNNSIKAGKWDKFNPKGEITLPLEEFLIYRNGSDVAEIDMRPLMQYPEYEHLIHARTYNEKAPFDETQETLLTVNFTPYPGITSQGIPVKLTFIDADISHDTELMGKMSPYIKVKVNNNDKWRSKTSKSGGKLPNFNREFVNLNLRSLNDTVSIEVWDDDNITKDDFIGGTHLKSYQLLGKGQEILEYPIAYSHKDKIINGGLIRFLAESPNLN